MGYQGNHSVSSSDSSAELSPPPMHNRGRPLTRSTQQRTSPAEPVRTRSRRKPPNTYSMKHLDAITTKRMQGAYARSTWARREMLDRQWETFRRDTHQNPTSTTAVRFFSWLSTNLLDTSLHTYVTTFLAMHPELKTQETRTYLRAIKRMNGLRPSSAVPGLTMEEAYRIMAACPPPLQLVFFIAWKTASRWGDVMSLTPSDIAQINENEAAVMFPATKATWMRPFRPDLLVHIVHREDITRLMAQVRHLHPHRPIVKTTTQQITAIMRKVLGKATISSRSIKRGAADILMSAAAEGLLPVEVAGRLLKHVRTPQLLSDTSVRYTTNKTALAVALGSGRATRIL